MLENASSAAVCDDIVHNFFLFVPFLYYLLSLM